MKGPVRWMARNHVAANLLMMTLVIGGVIKGLSVKQEVFPEVSLDKVRVAVAYPGAGPEEVEEGILRRIEENLSGLDGIKEIKSTAGEGFGVVNAELIAGEDVDLIMPEIKTEVDRITTFPEDAEKPVITKLLNRREVISVVVYGDLPERTLREHAERVREDLLSKDGITQVDLSGVRPYEISIEITGENLRRYGLTLGGVARSLRRSSLDLPGGTIKTEGGQILLRTKERRYLGSEYAALPLLTTPEGTEVRLGDIADVRDDFRETDEFARFDGKPAAMVRIYRVADQKPTEISREVIEYVDEKRGEFPPALGIATLNDTTEIFQSRMNLLIRNAALGLTLVIIILGLFLEIRLALWVMLGLPISFFGALLLMPFFGVSINMISLFAFILALGIVVDDAIVVGESIYAHRERGKPYLQAAVDGALEVTVPVIFAILTTVTAFLPLIFVSGMLGKFISNIPLVVIALLAVSLVESLFILPAHLAAGKHRERPGGLLGVIEFIRVRHDRFLSWFISRPYRSFLGLCIRYRYTTVAAAIAILMAAMGVVRGGVIKFEFMPRVDGDQVTASLKMPLGTPVEETARIQKMIVDKGMEVAAGYDRQRPEGDSVLRNIYSVVGGTVGGGGPAGGEGDTASHLSSVLMFLTESEKRNIPAAEIAERWRSEIGEIAGVDSLTLTSNLIRLGANIDIRAAHEDFTVLEEATARIRESLSVYPGVGDLADSLSRGKRELKIRLTGEARSLGVTEEDLGRQVRGAFFGAEALRLQRGRNEVKVMVRYPAEDRKSLADLESMIIRTPDGGEIPLSRAAVIEEGSGFAEINRTDRKRVVNVTASVDSRKANAQEIIGDLKEGILAELAGDYPGLSFDLEGEEKERRDALGSMKEGFLLSMVGIFALLAIPFRSYTQPVLIMIAIPFGIVGAVGGHLVMGYNLSMLSIFGIVALAGVVVNDSLLLIDQINRLRREENLETVQAVVDAGMRRFRPILLTSLTTFFGLSPMILEKSVQAKFLIPMAISLGFGILFATGITLLLIPSLYIVLEDFHNLFGLRAWLTKKTEKSTA